MEDIYKILLYFRPLYSMKSSHNYGPDQLGKAAVRMAVVEYIVSQALGRFSQSLLAHSRLPSV